MAEILPIRRKTLYNQSINQSVLWKIEQTWIYFTQGCLLPNLVEMGPVVLEKILKFLNAFTLSAWFFIWTNLNLLHPRMIRAKFG